MLSPAQSPITSPISSPLASPKIRPRSSLNLPTNLYSSYSDEYIIIKDSDITLRQKCIIMYNIGSKRIYKFNRRQYEITPNHNGSYYVIIKRPNEKFASIYDEKNMDDNDVIDAKNKYRYEDENISVIENIVTTVKHNKILWLNQNLFVVNGVNYEIRTEDGQNDYLCTRDNVKIRPHSGKLLFRN